MTDGGQGGYPPNILNARCPSRQLLALIADKWTLLVLAALSRDVRRTNALRREVDGISQKVLTETLRGLERNGLVTRTAHPVVPPKVEYALTDLGRSLVPLVQAMGSWAETHIADVHSARDRYDAPRASSSR